MSVFTDFMVILVVCLFLSRLNCRVWIWIVFQMRFNSVWKSHLLILQVWKDIDFSNNQSTQQALVDFDIHSSKKHFSHVPCTRHSFRLWGHSLLVSGNNKTKFLPLSICYCRRGREIIKHSHITTWHRLGCAKLSGEREGFSALSAKDREWWSNCVRQVDIWGRVIAGARNRKCNVPRRGRHLVCLTYRKRPKSLE